MLIVLAVRMDSQHLSFRPYMMRIAQALDMLRDHLPNTFINFVPLIDITITLVA